jgi:uncharacterized protein (TIGR02452 family)
MTKEELIAVYQDTMEICSKIGTPRTEKITFDQNTPQAGVDTEFIDRAGNIIVEPMDTVSALIKYSASGKTAVLNMASVHKKGGGVENGARAQEECLFRCSNLFTINQSLYPIKHDQYIYTHGASFVKDGQYGIMGITSNPSVTGFKSVIADVITMPALNLNNKADCEEEYDYVYLDKMFFMLNSALLNGCTNIILGAWGCGVYANKAEDIAKLFDEVLQGGELYKQFENVVFAVINDHNSTGNNYEVFKKQFS